MTALAQAMEQEQQLADQPNLRESVEILDLRQMPRCELQPAAASSNLCQVCKTRKQEKFVRTLAPPCFVVLVKEVRCHSA